MSHTSHFLVRSELSDLKLGDSKTCRFVRSVVSGCDLCNRSHGTRTCIKRKKIDYGKFFDFCAEKCVYN